MQIVMFLNRVLIKRRCVFVKAFQILTRGAPAWLEIIKQVRTPINRYLSTHPAIYIMHILGIHEQYLIH